MLSLPNKSLINTKIAQFYKITTIEKCDNHLLYYNDNGTFNFQNIVHHLWPQKNCEDIFKDLENYQYDDYLLCFNKLLPIFEYSGIILKEFRERFSDGLQLQWMDKNVDVYLNMSRYYNNNKTNILEHILVLTSIVANALTNVYLSQTQGKHAPHLLKDLINSKEIMDVFGLEIVLILKILMGSPNSINIRNIVWHGFPKPTEIPNYYVNVLLITIHSLGCIIQTKQLDIKARSQITTFNDHIKQITQNYEIETVELKQIEEKLIIFNSDYKYYWLQLLSYYKNKKYKEFIILALTQIELLLRLHYGRVNNFDISAKLDEYYITMDTIFETEVPNAEISNKLLDFNNSVFENCFHLLYDIFLSPHGCRLRDKVSHGEVYLEALNNHQLCSLILNIFIFLLFPGEYKFFVNYESIWHLNSKTKRNLNKLYEKLLNFKMQQFSNKDDFDLSQHKVLIFKRPKKESEFMLLINKIAENLYKTIENYEESITLRSNLLAQRELHSKRRKTLEKLQNTLPDIFKTLFGMYTAISEIFYLLQQDFEKVLADDVVSNKTIRFLKHCLCISENFVKYSHSESNEWIKSLELCCKYDEFRRKLFVFS